MEQRMDRFYVKDGQFWLNDRPQLIQAGEFHYYRTPQDQWSQRLSLLKDAGFNALATYIPWLWHQLEEGTTDVDGHSHPMRNLSGFLDLASEMGFFIIPRPGPYIMAETINEGIPPWVFRNYPQAAYISQDGKTQNVVSYLHPDFLACVQKWYKAVFEVLSPRQITRGGRIIMIQLDNEMGMIQWVRNIIDVNPDTLSRFVTYLSDRYGEHLAERYPNDNLVDYLRDGILHPQASHGGKIVEDYRRFYRTYLREYTSFLWEEAQANGMDVLPVINIHGFGNGGKTFPIGISQLIDVMGIDGMISATDVYPIFIGEGNFHQLLLVNEMTKALHNKEQALFSIEFQAGGNHDFGGNQSSLYDLHTRLCVSCGMRAINNYLFCDGENDPILSPTKRHDWGHPVRKDGTVRKHYHRYGKLSRVLNAYGSDLILSQPQPVTTIGFLLDYFMTEVNNPFTQEATNIITHQRDMVLFDFIARGLALTHRAFHAVGISRDTLNASQMPALWVMMDKQCDAAAQQRLVDYADQGGKLILVGRICTEDFNHIPCTTLKTALGLEEIKTDTPFTQAYINAFNYHDIPVHFSESYSGEFDEVFATRTTGEVVGFIRKMGKGKVMMFGAAMTANTLDDLDVVEQMAMKMGCPSPFTLSDWMDVRLSRGENGSFLFINNYQDDPLETTIEYEGKMLFDGIAVGLPARSGAILPLDWKLNPEVTIHYVTSEITERMENDTTITLKTEHNEFSAELTLTGYHCDGSIIISTSADGQRVELHSTDGVIFLQKNK
jgi:beta-galactosidase